MPDSLTLQHWIGVPGFPSEWAATGLTSLKAQVKGVQENPYRSMPFTCTSGLLQVANDFPGVVYILDGDRSGTVELT